jgi:ParB family transcriptional regulator, chromosome partitioning protein
MSKRQPKTVEHVDTKDIPKYAMDAQIINVELDAISPDPNQPRKFFNEQELQDLASSIREVGVMQAILVRPVGEGEYMIVFGERRYRASKLAEVKTIPCMVRELTDEQALEMQLTENLQRHNPHPIEDAVAFAKMAEKYDVKEISVRAGKSVTFVAGRLLLNKLIPGFQEMFFRNIMDMKTAISLAKLSTVDQERLFMEETNGEDDWKEDENFELGNMDYAIDQCEHALEKATFDTNDKELYAEAGACVNCPHNSKNNLSLWTRDDESAVCNSSVCWAIKTDRAFQQKVEQLSSDPNTIFVAEYHYSDSGKKRIADIKALGITVIDSDDITYRSDEPSPTIETLEEMIRDEEYRFFDDDFDDEDVRQKAVEILPEEVKKWEENQKVLSELRASGRLKNAFVIVGNLAGQTIPATIDDDTMAQIAEQPSSVQGQIKQWNDKEKRAKELDSEKVWEACRKLLLDNKREAFKKNSEMLPVEKQALIIAMMGCMGYNQTDYFREKVLRSGEGAIGDAEAVMKLKGKKLDDVFNICARLMMAEKLFTSGGGVDTGDSNYMGMQLSFLYLPNEVNDIQVKQQEAAKKRAARLADKIAALKKSE